MAFVFNRHFVMGLTNSCSWLLRDPRHLEDIAGAFVYRYLIFSVGTMPCLLLENRRFGNLLIWLLLVLLTHLYEDVLLYFTDVNFLSTTVCVLDDFGLSGQLSRSNVLLFGFVVV